MFPSPLPDSARRRPGGDFAIIASVDGNFLYDDYRTVSDALRGEFRWLLFHYLR